MNIRMNINVPAPSLTRIETWLVRNGWTRQDDRSSEDYQCYSFGEGDVYVARPYLQSGWANGDLEKLVQHLDDLIFDISNSMGREALDVYLSLLAMAFE